ncbi:type II toxin-antitoxin system RatA family toxin [Alphaproteobacteria bacterium]|nr:type II toxin-antitoxin system RatA family toxin [Alphaproteobacteria bacterium]
MKNSQREEIVNFSANQLFDIVIDIESYPDYIPWCSSMIVNKRKNNEIFADMYVKYKFIVGKFGSHVKYDTKKLIIKTNYIEGPLKDLNTQWRFKNISKNKSKIIFEVNFEFKSFMHQKIAETFYPLIETKMIKSFKKRAEDILN